MKRLRQLVKTVNRHIHFAVFDIVKSHIGRRHDIQAGMGSLHPHFLQQCRDQR